MNKKIFYVSWKAWILSYKNGKVTKTKIKEFDKNNVIENAMFLVNKQWMSSDNCCVVEELANGNIENNVIRPDEDIERHYKNVILHYKEKHHIKKM